jgi:hypothetical protein
MIYALSHGLKSVARSWGVVLVVLAVNLTLAALLAVPLGARLERDLAKTESARNMLYGFDHAWWSAWSDAQSGWEKSFSPEIFGAGFAFKNVESLLRGELPLGAMRQPTGRVPEGGPPQPSLDPVILGLAALYLVLQTFLLGGILGVFRSEQGAWTLRAVFHGSGFYFGRLLRVALVGLLLDYVLFRLNAPFARWADARAREAVSENTALAWSLGRHGLLLLALLVVSLLSSYAKVIVVLEERTSALLAWLSALGFCARNAAKALGHYLAVVLLGVLLLLGWAGLDARIDTTGYKSQLWTLLLLQAFVFARIALRLSLPAGQMALYRRRTTGL